MGTQFLSSKMNFFQAVHGEDSDNEENYQIDFELSLEKQEGNNPNPRWSFGKSIKNRLQIFFRNFKELYGDLKEGAEEIGEVASLTLDLGVTIAQESLQSVGQAIEECGSFAWNATAGIISHGKDAVFAGDSENDSSDDDTLEIINPNLISNEPSGRFEAELQSIRTDIRTYHLEPEDLNDFNEWKSGFVLEEKTEEIEALIWQNEFMDAVYGNLVSSDLDHEIFWTRYFYRVYKLKQMEDARALLLKKAISRVEEEDLSWDADNDDEMIDCGNGSGLNADQSVAKTEENTSLDGKTDADESSRNSDFSVVSHPSFTEEEDDLGWDQLEGLDGKEERICE